MNPLRAISALVPLALALSLPAQFAPGNLVVVRAGDGTAALTSAATAMFFDEYTPAGALVQTVPMRTAVSGSNQPCTNSGSATSEGFITLSADGRYFLTAGYAAIPGTTGVVGTANPPTSRIIARTDMAGNIDTTTAIGDAFSLNNIRSVTSDDGNRFWCAGANSGIRFVASLGATTSVQVNTGGGPANNRVVGIFGGQLYVTSSSGTTIGLCSVGTGLPTTAGATEAILPGFPTAAGPSSYDFFFADANTVYVADDRNTTATGGGIQKWTFSASTWTLQYTLFPPGTNVGCRGLHGVVTGGVATLFATTTQTSANTLVTVTDTGAASAFTLVATAPANTAFRGVRRVPGTYLVFGPGCPGSLGVPGNVGLDAPMIGTTFSASITNLPVDASFFIFGWSNTSSAFGPLPLNLAGFGAPGCFGRVSTDSVALITGAPQSNVATFNLGIPNNTAFVGTVFYTQGLAISPGTNALGGVTSDAARGIVGN
jgi:hypothetical protein